MNDSSEELRHEKIRASELKYGDVFQFGTTIYLVKKITDDRILYAGFNGSHFTGGDYGFGIKSKQWVERLHKNEKRPVSGSLTALIRYLNLRSVGVDRSDQINRGISDDSLI